MHVFLVGGTGVVGRRLVPELVSRGHRVTATSRSGARLDDLRVAGAEAIALDVLDASATLDAVREARPDVIVHQATALSGDLDVRRFDEVFGPTNLLRTSGTDNLLAAARAVGVRRVVAQSFAGWLFAREGTWVKSEDAPLDPDPPRQVRRTHAAISHLERVVTAGEGGIEGIVLRYGGFYGPGTSLGPGGSVAEAIRRRRYPIIGAGRGMWSLVHVDDVALPTALAIESGSPGVYHVVDDEPAAIGEWVTYAARVMGAPAPFHLPRWLGRLLAGEHVVLLMNEGRAASNAKARRELGWQPIHGSWREGVAATFAAARRAADAGAVVAR